MNKTNSYMKRNTIKILISIYFNVVNKIRKNPKPSKIENYMHMSIFDFCEAINKMPYEYDKLHGLIDNVADVNTFFDDKTSDRDCDDFARMWSWWLTYNGYKAAEYCIANPNKLFSTLHMITVGEKNGEYWLMNYYYYGPFKSLDETLEYMSRFKSYSDDRIIVKSNVEFKL